MNEWNIQAARDTYNLAHWGEGYVDINDAGNVVVRPLRGADGPAVDLHALVGEIRAAGLPLPVLVRFADILRDRVGSLCGAFAAAMQADGYEGAYTAVYPIKVNQQRAVVDHILSAGGGQVGLEAGSKPELMAVLGLAPADSVIICNGYKDRTYVRLALIGRRLGHRVFIVVEKLSEIDHIIALSRELDIEPLIGFRMRLSSIGAGKWQNTGGEKSKFGLSASDALRAVERLREAGMLESLELVHFHLGSQIANIRDIQRGMREAARYYAELRALGAPVRYVDVGGGLGVDYEGTRSRSFCSMNYSVQEYANNVVHTLWDLCAEQGLPHPDIITEAGRAMTAHHAVLVTDVIDVERRSDEESFDAPDDEAPLILKNLWQVHSELNGRSPLESYHDAVHWLSEAQAMFTLGVIGLGARARAEQLYFGICRGVQRRLQPALRAHRELLDELNEKLADKYFCNFSLFQSLPDVWAIDQIFPIVPLHRLGEAPGRRGILGDLTCDSDGRIDHYVDREGIESTLPMHGIVPGQAYVLGIFLVGAYQEILGDMHNLFGDTHAVNVELCANGGHRLVQPESGDTVDDVLRYVHIDPAELVAAYQAKIARAELSEAQREAYLTELRAGLTGYTYLGR
jgi:arginine decarboxylase